MEKPIKTGRPKFEPTDADRKIVAEMSRGFIKQECIAEYLGINVNTLRKYFKKEIKKEKTRVVGLVENALIKKCLKDGDVKAMIFFLERHGWTIKPPSGEDAEASINIILEREK